jgi:diphthamide synthase (EF-2-diphthine--ammonia ligase)
MFQVPTTALAGMQAASADIPWLPIATEGDEDGEMQILENALESVVHGSRKPRSETWSNDEINEALWPDGWKWPSNLRRLRSSGPIQGLVVGAIRSDYQKTRIEQMCSRLNIKSFTPLWHHEGIAHMRELVSHGHKIMITSVTTDGMGEKWVGRILNHTDVLELEELADEYRFNVDGEGGEFESAVLDAPWMNSQIKTQHTIHWTGRRGWVDIWGAELVEGEWESKRHPQNRRPLPHN